MQPWICYRHDASGYNTAGRCPTCAKWPLAEPIHIPRTIWLHFARHHCANTLTGSILRCDLTQPDPTRAHPNGHVPPSEHEGDCSGVCPYCKERFTWETEAPSAQT